MNTFNELINSDTPVLVDFFAEWCGPCKMMPPVLNEVKNALSSKVRVIKVDIDKNPNVARAYHVQSVPTLIIFKQGQVKWRQSGVVPANALIGQLNQVMT